MHKNQLTLLLCLGVFTALFSNAAQPGLWQAGGTGTFSLLFPQDQHAYQQIQMARERVSIQLYDGFAAVKGTYWMHNTADSTYKILTGYPINGIYESDYPYHREDIRFDDLYQLRVAVNGQPIRTEIENVPNNDYGQDIDNWYIWETDYPAQDTTMIEVYFLVNTHDAIIRDGYTTENANGFLYLLESGATWKQPIGRGNIRVQLMDGLELADIRGVAPDSLYHWHAAKKRLDWSFVGLSPKPADNLVITYHSQHETIDFEAITRDADRYFNALERLDAAAPLTAAGVLVGGRDPFAVTPAPSGWSWWWYVLGIGALLGILLLLRMMVRR